MMTVAQGPLDKDIDAIARSLATALGADDVRVREPMARYTTWRVGGRAAVLCIVHDADALLRAVAVARTSGLPWLVLGRGSNILIDDAGVQGVVIVNRATGLAVEGTLARAESGVLLSVLARHTVARGLEGLEWCHDIPGTVGGGVVNNAGAHGGSIADVLRSARILWADGSVCELRNGDLGFGYRQSILRHDETCLAGARPVVLEAAFELRATAPAGVMRRLQAQRARRKATQPGGASAGSVFKNPPGDSAGRLVESVGLKGARVGDAAVSTLHGNFIVTGPRASASDVLGLIALMQQRVRVERGVALTPEVQYVFGDGRVGSPPTGASV